MLPFLPLVAVALAVVIFGAVFPIIAVRASRWNRIAGDYPLHEKRSAYGKRFQSLTVNGFQYHKCFEVACDETGLVFRALFPFSLSHKVASVPYTELIDAQETKWGMHIFRLARLSATGDTIGLSPQLAKTVLTRQPPQVGAASGGLESGGEPS